jgi:hypothetical protein
VTGGGTCLRKRLWEKGGEDRYAFTRNMCGRGYCVEGILCRGSPVPVGKDAGTKYLKVEYFSWDKNEGRGGVERRVIKVS